MAAATQENRSKLNYNFNSTDNMQRETSKKKKKTKKPKWKTKRQYKITTINHCAPLSARAAASIDIFHLPASSVLCKLTTPHSPPPSAQQSHPQSDTYWLQLKALINHNHNAPHRFIVANRTTDRVATTTHNQ